MRPATVNQQLHDTTADIGLSEFHDALLTPAAHNGLADVKGEILNTSRANLSDLPQALDYLESVDFYVQFRGTSVPNTLSDLTKCEDETQVRALLAKNFNLINLLEEIRASRLPNYEPDQFSVDSEDDRHRYFCQFLPKRTATNLARMHNLSIVHGHLGLGNILLSGGLKDLDYVAGPFFNDKLRTDYRNEVELDRSNTLDAITQTLDSLHYRDIFYHFDGQSFFARYAAEHQFNSTYVNTQTASNMFYPLRDIAESAEFLIAYPDSLAPILDNAPDPQGLEYDMVNSLVRIYGIDWQPQGNTNPEQDLDYEALFECDFIINLQSRIQTTQAKPLQNGLPI